jgi:hypothetical protein
LAGKLLFNEKIRQSAALLWFGLRNVEVFHSQAAIQRTIDVPPEFLEHGSTRFEHMQTVIQTSRRIRDLFAESGSELGSCFKYSALNLKNQKHIAVDVPLKAYPMVPLSCRSNLAGRYL